MGREVVGLGRKGVCGVLKDGELEVELLVNENGPADSVAAKDFKLKGHEWQRAFTAEVP